MSQSTTIHVYTDQRDRLETAAETLFGTTEVPHRVTIDRLLADHDDIAYDGE